MDRIILALTLGIYLHGSAVATEPSAEFFDQESLTLPSPLSRYFIRVPESQAHLPRGQAREMTLNPSSIKALVWNIKKAMLVDWRREFQVYGQDKDLFLLQEAYKTDLFKATLEKFPHIRWDMGISFLYREYGNTPTGSMIGSEAEPLEVVIRQSTALEPVVKTPKSMTMAKYPLDGSPKELLVISIHAINFTGLKSFKDQLAQATEEISHHNGPVFFAGDFNTHHPLRTTHLMEQMKKFGLTPVEFKNGHQRMKFAGNYLDHGFVRGLKVKHAEVFGESVGSDHKPMVLELSLSDELQ
jgi:endonuclease/exonuclease/phosphatase (EEP) superfamily protein YafD